jgi:PAS domain S-box-containing protein
VVQVVEIQPDQPDSAVGSHQQCLPIERLPLAYIAFDREIRVLEWNPAAERIFGYTRREALGQNILQLIVPSPPNDHIQEILRRIWTGDLEAHSVNENRTKDGRIITCDWFNTPICDTTGKVTGVISIGQDTSARRRHEETFDRDHSAIDPSGHGVDIGDKIDERKTGEVTLGESADRLRELSQRLIEVQELERQHLARELHDEIGQILSTISVSLRANMQVCHCVGKDQHEENISIIDQAIEQVRNLALDLRPSMLDDIGLVATMRWCAERQARRANFELDFVAESTGEPLPAKLQITCYRVAQEALTNIVRHAKARLVTLEFRQSENDVAILIRDDGVGYDQAEVQQRIASGTSFGVRGMQERVELLGGIVKVESLPEEGTTIRVHLPVTE